ncbi:hypothetical protein F5I97DRAFT_1874301 [Phlebopus sp. FC_14]|nr:hypothetical protein F5I97DRAFT_1874301 [Phlebopus sp. FC_14]
MHPSNTNRANLRQPDPGFKGRNGFRESHIPVDKDHPDDITLRNHRLAQYVLSHKGSYLPSPDALRDLGKTNAPPVDTVANVEAKIKEIKAQHAKDLECLFAFQAAEYHQEVLDHQRCFDDSDYMVIDESYPSQVEFREELFALDKRMRQMSRFKRDMDDGLSMLRYTHLKTLLPLIQKRNALKAREQLARKQRDARFPQTVEEYRQIPERDVRLRIARFLSSSDMEQERMMQEFQWAYRGVQRLLSTYKSSMQFKTEIDDTIKDIHATDPRRRATQIAKSAEQALPYATFAPIS